VALVAGCWVLAAAPAAVAATDTVTATGTSQSAVQNSVFYGPGQFISPFGPNQFCGTLRQPIIKKEKNGRRKVVGTKKVHRCIVPRSAFVTLTVTYSAT
jgi:hypothetical protein